MISTILFLVSFGFYLHGASPTLYGGDSGELMTSAHVLGISHAPGYPLHALLYKFIERLIPFGSPVFRLNAVSAVVGAFTVALLYILLREFISFLFPTLSSRVIALVALITSLFFATRPLVIEQARTVEVFTLNVLMDIGIGLCNVMWLKCNGQDQRLSWLYLCGLVFGLGLGNHHTLVVATSLLMWMLIEERKVVPALVTGAFFFLGLSIYLYLPLRSWANPPVNFGDPDTWSRFIAVITRKEFGALSLHPAAVPFRDISLVVADLQQFLARNLEQLGVVGLGVVLMCIFMGALQKSSRLWVALFSIAWIGVGAGFEIFSNLSPGSDIGQWRLERFLMLPVLWFGALIAIGLGACLSASRIQKGIGVCFIVLIGAAVVSTADRTHDFRRNYVFRDFAISALRSAPYGSKVIIDRVLFDEPTSSILVATQIESKRPDIQFLYRPGTLFNQVYGDDVLELNWNKRFERQQEVESRELANFSGPVRVLAFEKKNTPFKNPNLSGLLYAEAGSVSNVVPFLVDRSLYQAPSTDYPRRLIGVHFPYFAAKAAIERGDMSAADKWFNVAGSKNPDMAWLASNIGGIYAQKEIYTKADEFFKQAVRNDPYFPEGYIGLGYLQMKAGKYLDAKATYEHAKQLAPHRMDIDQMIELARVWAANR